MLGYQGLGFMGWWDWMGWAGWERSLYTPGDSFLLFWVLGTGMMGDRKVRYILREYQVSFFYMFSVRVSDVWDEDDLLLVTLWVLFRS